MAPFLQRYYRNGSYHLLWGYKMNRKKAIWKQFGNKWWHNLCIWFAKVVCIDDFKSNPRVERFNVVIWRKQKFAQSKNLSKTWKPFPAFSSPHKSSSSFQLFFNALPPCSISPAIFILPIQLFKKSKSLLSVWFFKHWEAENSDRFKRSAVRAFQCQVGFWWAFEAVNGGV